MVWYAETGARRMWQLFADIAMVVWTWCWWRAAVAAHDLVGALGSPGRTLAATGERLQGGFGDVAAAVSGTPLIGGALQAPFSELADAADAIAGVGAAQDAAASALADWIGALVFLMPVLAVGVVWAVVRVRGAWRTGAVRDLRACGDIDLLALRALTHSRLRELSRIAAAPAAGWRAGDVATIQALATLELGRVGLRPAAGPRDEPASGGDA